MILEVVGRKDGLDRCPGASARVGATQRAQRCDDAALIMKERVCGSSLVVSLWSLIGVLLVSVIPLVFALFLRFPHEELFCQNTFCFENCYMLCDFRLAT